MATPGRPDVDFELRPINTILKWLKSGQVRHAIRGGRGDIRRWWKKRCCLGPRLQGEPARAYRAAMLYLGLGAKRSLREVCRQVYGENAACRRQIERWSVRWAWRRRAEEWDDLLESECRQAMIVERREMGRRQAAEAKVMQAVALRRLESLDIDEMGPGDVLRFLIEACKLERQAVGGYPDLDKPLWTRCDQAALDVEDRPTMIRTRMDVADFATALPHSGSAGRRGRHLSVWPTVKHTRERNVEETKKGGNSRPSLLPSLSRPFISGRHYNQGFLCEPPEDVGWLAPGVVGGFLFVPIPDVTKTLLNSRIRAFEKKVASTATVAEMALDARPVLEVMNATKGTVIEPKTAKSLKQADALCRVCVRVHDLGPLVSRCWWCRGC